MTRVRVAAGGRVHFGFQNLSLAHERLYGGLGVALDEPRVVLVAEPADAVRCDDTRAAACAERVVELLDVPGVELAVEEHIPHHVGLGSGTQFALAVLTAVAHAHDREPRVRERAPSFGRGG
ncbi:GHMP family kinase ATP-binding protein, partial [Halococcus hamelinensis]